MITKSKQTWLTDSIVNVGFLKLKVVSAKAVKDGMPDIYTLTSLDGKKTYEFIPHNGLRLVTNNFQRQQ
jgi:hypothetical protein